jgi:hypothetical protein
MSRNDTKTGMFLEPIAVGRLARSDETKTIAISIA